MSKKNELISDILQSIRFDYIEKWANNHKVDGIIETNLCSVEKWKELLDFYDIKRYMVIKKLLDMVKNDTNANIDSIKAEVYDIGKGRNPSVKHIQALLQIIFEKHSYQSVHTLRSSLEIQKIFVLTQTLQELAGNEGVIFYSEKDVANILSNLNIDTLQEIHEKFTSDKWVNAYEDYTDEDYITHYLENMDGTNLLFLYHNAECLCLYYDIIEFILKQLAYVDPDKMKKEYENLKKKRIYGSIGKCFLALNALNYEPPSEPVTKEMVTAIEQNLSNFPEMESLIFSIGKLTPLKWNFLLLLIKNYEEYPTEKKVRTWLEKVQYDI